MNQKTAEPGPMASTVHFPANFIWGTATAAHQVEGGNSNSDFWALEHATPSFFKEPSWDAIDQWNRFADDVALLASLGLGSYRFSVEWARVEPEEGRFSTAALDHYQRCIDACLQRGIKPILTMFHFSSPLWITRKGGFANPEFPDLFARYCGHVASALRGVDMVCTINELNVPVLLAGRTSQMLASDAGKERAAAAQNALGNAIQSSFLFTPPAVIVSNGLDAHRKARDAIKAVNPKCRVGVTLSIQDEQAAPGAERARDKRREAIYETLLDAVKGDDFIGVQTYTRLIVQPDGLVGPEPGHPLTVMGYEDRPQALADVCRYVWERTRTPIFVTENGWAGDDDNRRAAFIHEALRCLKEVIDEGALVLGYLYWSAFDNFEWLDGFHPKFGIIAVDHSTLRRTMRRSALLLGEIAQANAVVPLSPPAVAESDTAQKQNYGGGMPLGMNLD